VPARGFMVLPIFMATSIIGSIQNTVTTALYRTGATEPSRRDVSIKPISGETKCGMDGATWLRADTDPYS